MCCCHVGFHKTDSSSFTSQFSPLHCSCLSLSNTTTTISSMTCFVEASLKSVFSEYFLHLLLSLSSHYFQNHKRINSHPFCFSPSEHLTMSWTLGASVYLYFHNMDRNGCMLISFLKSTHPVYCQWKLLLDPVSLLFLLLFKILIYITSLTWQWKNLVNKRMLIKYIIVIQLAGGSDSYEMLFDFIADLSHYCALCLPELNNFFLSFFFYSCPVEYCHLLSAWTHVNSLLIILSVSFCSPPG